MFPKIKYILKSTHNMTLLKLWSLYKHTHTHKHTHTCIHIKSDMRTTFSLIHLLSHWWSQSLLCGRSVWMKLLNWLVFLNWHLNTAVGTTAHYLGVELKRNWGSIGLASIFPLPDRGTCWLVLLAVFHDKHRFRCFISN